MSELQEGYLERQWAGLASLEGLSLLLCSGLVRVPPECCGGAVNVLEDASGEPRVACGGCGRPLTWTYLLCPLSDPELSLAIEEWLQGEGYSVLESSLLGHQWEAALRALWESERVRAGR